MIRNLQILRAIAAILVVFFHCEFLGIQSGQFGVDIFFVISGFIIAFVLNKNTRFFLVKRFARIIPMYYLFTFLLILAWLLYPSGFKNVVVNTEAILKSLFFIPYYVGDSGPILSLGWTLNYEIYFYVLAGFSAWLLRSPGKGLLATAIIIVLIDGWMFLTQSENQYIRFYGNPVTLEFLYGILLYYITTWKKERLSSQAIVTTFAVAAAGALVLLFCFDYFRIRENRQWVFGIPAFFLVLFSIISDKQKSGTGIWYNILYEAGNASYVIYLLHPFVIYFYIRIVNPRLPSGVLFSILELPLMLGTVVGISIFVHRYAEKPAVAFLERLAVRKKV
jgi:peptidoglycan/LPS O-acetylase OafA/YrhL